MAATAPKPAVQPWAFVSVITAHPANGFRTARAALDAAVRRYD